MLLAHVAGLLATSILIRGGLILDGSGSDGFVGDVRIRGAKIEAIGALKPMAGERVIDAKDLVVAPGFIDAHSHADGAIDKEPGMVSQLSQGITTAVVGQDGIWREPVAGFLDRIARAKPALNFATFCGHGGVRSKVMGDDYKRAATYKEITQMKLLVEADLLAGAIGLSTGLEYDPGYYAPKSELIELSKTVAQSRGMYISHIRNEDVTVDKAIEELISISQAAGCKAQVSHIKIGAKSHWNGAAGLLATMSRTGVTADVYPYTFWQSGVAALSPSRDWADDSIWVAALAVVGGPQNVRITKSSSDATWVGKTLAELSASLKKSSADLIQELLKAKEQSVMVTAMSEGDLITFMRNKNVMFSSDGSPGGSHPRSAGSFPRILGVYVREKKLIRLGEAIRKMTSLPAKVFGFANRGRLKKGFAADVVVFDPLTIKDTATVWKPTSLSVGVKEVFVNGVHVVSVGKATGERGGVAIRATR